MNVYNLKQNKFKKFFLLGHMLVSYKQNVYILGLN